MFWRQSTMLVDATLINTTTASNLIRIPSMIPILATIGTTVKPNKAWTEELRATNVRKEFKLTGRTLRRRVLP